MFLLMWAGLETLFLVDSGGTGLWLGLGLWLSGWEGGHEEGREGGSPDGEVDGGVHCHPELSPPWASFSALKGVP